MFSLIENIGFFEILTVRGAIADASSYGFWRDIATRPKQLRG